jgi:hypothetical protein
VTDGQLSPIQQAVADYQAIQEKFEQQLWERWKPAFDLYDAVLFETQNVALYFRRQYQAQAVAQDDSLYKAQVLLQARAYRTSCEVRALLLSGNPDGALARWRTMYEIYVVMLFLQTHGAETARRFLEYDLVQTTKNLDQFDDLSEDWKSLPVDPEEGAQIKAELAALAQGYEPSFVKGNGWAAGALGRTGKPGNISFADLEADVGLKNLLFYNVASNHVHANVKGLAEDPYIELVPSMRDFTAPASSTLAALSNCTEIMVQLRRTAETDELIKILEHLATQASETFLRVQQQIEQEEKPA